MIYVQIAGAIALLALAVLIASFVPAALRLGKTVGSLDEILGQLKTTVEEVNSELSKVNETTASVQRAVSRIDNVAELVEKTVSSPLIKVAGYGAGLTGIIRSFAHPGAKPKTK
jgi:uncharacterized protein YoxC